MKYSAALAVLLLFLTALPVVAQSTEEARAVVQIEAHVLKALDSTPASGGIEEVSEMVPGMLGNQTTAAGLDVTDIATLSQAVANVPQTPGVVITMLVLGRDGAVVSGDARNATLPDWMTTDDLIGTGAARDSGAGYYIYINVCACNV
jgi:hypothetical protein